MMMDGLTEEDIDAVLRAFEASHFSRFELAVGAVRIAADRAAAAAAPALRTSDVVAPLLGMFQAGLEPGVHPLVAPGTDVQPDTIIGMIRVMETVTPVKAGVRGAVTEVWVEDGQLVEFGQPLLRVGTEPGSNRRSDR